MKKSKPSKGKKPNSKGKGQHKNMANSKQRKPRLLWANPFCMLDTSSGASMAIREMLIQLVHQGYEVMIVGATIFDAENGTYKLKEHWQIIQEKHNEVIKVNDGVLTHHLVATKSIVRNQMTTQFQNMEFPP